MWSCELHYLIDPKSLSPTTKNTDFIHYQLFTLLALEVHNSSDLVTPWSSQPHPLPKHPLKVSCYHSILLSLSLSS